MLGENCRHSRHYAAIKTDIGQLTQLAMINRRRRVTTALAEQEQHYSIPTTAVPP